MPGQVVTTLEQWVNQYKEQRIEIDHDDAMFDLVSPDDSILVAGPARLSGAGLNNGEFYIIGVCQSFQASETSQIQPFKAIGSRRHLFTKTNTPAQASMARMMLYGKNLARALYSHITDPFTENPSTNNKYVQGKHNVGYQNSKFLSNLEEDLYRIPFGLGIIYHTPRTAHNASQEANIAVGAEYLEACYLQSRNISMQSGQTIVMEQVQMLSDRIVPWNTYGQSA